MQTLDCYCLVSKTIQQTELACKITVVICVLATAVFVCSLQLKHPSTMHRLSLSPQQWIDPQEMIHHQYFSMMGICSSRILLKFWMVMARKGTKFTNSVQVNTSCMEIKDQLWESLKEHFSCDKFDIGHIEAGRQGIRGKTRWIFSSEDIDDMYESYKSAGKTEIILWCDGRRQVAGKKKAIPYYRRK